MRIQVLYGYRGVPTGNKYLPAGEHEVDAGLGEYLVANGHAIALDTPEPKTENKPESGKPGVGSSRRGKESDSD